MRLNRLFVVAAVAGAALLTGACYSTQKNNHDELRHPKEISVSEEEGWHVGWEKTSVSLSVNANCYWGVEFFSWKDQVMQEGDTIKVLSSAGWLRTASVYGNGDASITVDVDANSYSKSRRTGYVKVYTGDPEVYSLVPLVQDGNPDYEGLILPPLDLQFDFTNNDMGWPTQSQSVGEVTYPLDGVNYGFYLGRCNIGAHLIIHNTGSYLGLPAIEHYRLARVTFMVSATNKQIRQASIVADPEGLDVVSPTQIVPALPSVEMVFDLTGTDINTRYYLLCPGGPGLPVAVLTLHYEPEGS